MKVYYDKDADINIIKKLNVSIIGYGSQGHAHALNLKDSGVNVTVGLRVNSQNATRAEAEGLNVLEISEAVNSADIVMILAPDEYQGELMGDLNRRRGQIQGMETRGNVCVIEAFVPLENMFGYSTDMRSLSSGRADYSMTPSHFEQVPQNLVQSIVETSSREPSRT